MRVFAASDIHGDVSLAERLAQQAQDEKVDVIVLCGDLTFQDQEPTGVLGPFARRNQKVLIIPGNHDSHATTDMLTKLYPVNNLHGYGARYEDIGIFACGKANIGLEQMSEDELFETLKKAHGSVSYLGKKIMVTHVHPAGTMMEKMTNFMPPSVGVRRAIDELQPDIALCGHVHEADGLEETIGSTRLVNVGRKGFVFDL